MLVAIACVAGCGSTPHAGAPTASIDDSPQAADATRSPPAAFEQRQRDRALGFMRQKRFAEAAVTWEVLGVLRPDVGEYRERLAETQRQIDAAVAERLPRAAQAAQRGDIDAATQHYLAVLALQPQNEPAADALRALERERNKRNYLGKYSRFTITRRAIADAEMPANAGHMADRNDIEHAALLAGMFDVIAIRHDIEHAALLAGDGEFDEAIGLLERRLVADRRDAAARRLLASVYYRKAESLSSRDKSAAVAALEKSVRLDPVEPIAAARLRQLKGGSVAAPATPVR